MENFIQAHEIAGAVTLVATPEKVLHLDAVGHADIASGRAMKPDSIFWIASMTKPVTGVAVMMLHEAGKLSLEDPVSKHLPEFKGITTSDGKPAQLTIRHLLTHTSGMAEISPEEARRCRTLADAVALYASRPLGFEPGARWQYCQSSINTAARIVEVVSGESFPEFLEKRLFQPLGMKDTTFYLSESQLPRLATSYRRTDDGVLEASENHFLLGLSAASRDRFPAANGGLFSTAPDYARFCQMIAQGRRVRWPPISFAREREDHDERADRFLEDWFHRGERLGLRLVRRARTAGCHRHVVARHSWSWRRLRHPGVD